MDYLHMKSTVSLDVMLISMQNDRHAIYLQANLYFNKNPYTFKLGSIIINSHVQIHGGMAWENTPPLERMCAHQMQWERGD